MAKLPSPATHTVLHLLPILCATSMGIQVHLKMKPIQTLQGRRNVNKLLLKFATRISMIHETLVCKLIKKLPEAPSASAPSAPLTAEAAQTQLTHTTTKSHKFK